jgi:hypothetical protein
MRTESVAQPLGDRHQFGSTVARRDRVVLIYIQRLLGLSFGAVADTVEVHPSAVVEFDLALDARGRSWRLGFCVFPVHGTTGDRCICCLVS